MTPEGASKLPNVVYRAAVSGDVAALARIRAAEWESEQYWMRRIAGYMQGDLRPQHALRDRIIVVAEDNGVVIGLIAGHLTRRFGCEGELEWIDVIREQRRRGVGSEMVRILAHWFVLHKALRVCVDPGNPTARQFYARLGAENLNHHWMHWPDITVLLNTTSAGASAPQC